MVQTQIRYVTPFALDKNIGKAYNEAISELPDDCFVVLRDGDTMFLTTEWGNQIEQIIKYNQDYDVITCMTNRIGVRECLLYSEFMDKPIEKQIEIAQTCWLDHKADVKQTLVAPGMLMIFHKSTWAKHKFRENSIIFDRQFSNDVIRSGGKIGVAKGLYIFHLYRFGQENPQSYTKHLKK
jgi:hypothetical protein